VRLRNGVPARAQVAASDQAEGTPSTISLLDLGNRITATLRRSIVRRPASEAANPGSEGVVALSSNIGRSYTLEVKLLSGLALVKTCQVCIDSPVFCDVATPATEVEKMGEPWDRRLAVLNCLRGRAGGDPDSAAGVMAAAHSVPSHAPSASVHCSAQPTSCASPTRATPRPSIPLARSHQPEWTVVRNVYDGLVDWNPGNRQLVPGLATSWHHNADATVWTFNLRRGVRFHDGAPFNSTAARKTIEYYKKNVWGLIWAECRHDR